MAPRVVLPYLAPVHVSGVNGRIEARVDIDTPSATGSTEYAFHLFHEGRRAGHRSYEPSPRAEFPLVGPGHYAVTVFSRASVEAPGERIAAGEVTVETDSGQPPPRARVEAVPAEDARPAVRDKVTAWQSGDRAMTGAILHIGLPKTGTTYLQRTLHTALGGSDDASIDYPETGFYNHQIALYEPLGRYLPWKVRATGGDHWKRLSGHISEGSWRPLLLSAEALSALSPAGVAAFKQLLGSRQARRIVITTRPLVTLLPSHWQQNMKQGGRGDLESYARRILAAIDAGESPAQMFCVLKTIQLWRAEFPECPVSVLVMDGGHAQNLLVFARICGLGDEHRRRLLTSVPIASEQNLSFSLEECKKLLLINERIARGQLPVSARRKAMDSFFRQRQAGVSYSKPELGSELRAVAQEIDDRAFAELERTALVEILRGRDLLPPVAV